SQGVRTEGNVCIPEERRPRGELVGTGTAVLADEKIRPRNHPAHETGREPHVPLPPDAPRLPRPQRTGDEDDRTEEDGELRGCVREAILPRRSAEEESGARNSAHDC